MNMETVMLDLETLNSRELKELRAQIDDAIEAAEKRDFALAQQAAEKAAREYGFSLIDLAKVKSSQGGKAKLPPKYQNPDNPEQTWSGMGRRPQWIKDADAEGRSRDEFLIK